MNGRPSLFFLLFAVVLALPLSAQPDGTVTIRGQVASDSTGAPLDGAHVFISGSLTGTTVSEDGTFRLANISSGAKRLYVTHVGYEPEQLDLVLPSDTTLSFDFRLRPTVIRAPAVHVSGERDDEWYEHVARFKELFIGASKQADQCTLLNPRALYFDTAWWGKFEADATRPLIFENRALGYRVTYYLEAFEVRGDIVRWDGEPVYKPLTPRDSAEAARWAENRREAFYGSLRHFLLALLHDRLEAEEFQMFRMPRHRAFRKWGRADRLPVDRNHILTLHEESLHEIDFDGVLEIRYHGAPETRKYLEWGNLHRSTRDHQTSHIRLNEHPIHVDRHGEVLEPYGATLFRYFAFRQRIANMLPREYRPSGTALAAFRDP